MDLEVSEIFYSLQGEGGRAGEPSIFIRLQGCKAKNACYAMGVRCDTDFESGGKWELTRVEEWIEENGKGCKWIIWTGGEPAQQLTDEIISYFKDRGFSQAIETSGLLPVPEGLDYVVVSPKVAEHVVKKNFSHVHELRYVRHAGQDVPSPSITADHYYISPHSDGMNINSENLAHAVDLCLKNPQWALSVQMHKIWKVL